RVACRAVDSEAAARRTAAVTRRYLFGPVDGAFADQNLRAARAAGACLTFGRDDSADVCVHASDTWESVQSRLPDGWRPDFAALRLAYAAVPKCLWSAPVPLVGLAAD